MIHSYHYTACGLDVTIEGLEPVVDDAGEKTYRIPNSIVVRSHGISPAELRFLRTEMGLTQSELAVVIKKDHQTVGRWERGETPIDPNAELVIRMLAVERLQLDPEMTIEEMAQRCVPSAEFSCIVVDGSEPGNYHAKAA
jgi:transcriptional regulator with XRE-family HTH domain